MRIFLLVYGLLFLSACLLLRAFLFWKKTGKNPIVLSSGDRAHDYIGQWFKLLIVLAVINLFFFYLEPYFPSLYPRLHPFMTLQTPLMAKLSVVILCFSFALCFYAQNTMGDSWRVGIDEAHRTGLVARGVYRFSRNPIYLSILGVLLGLFLATPNVLTLLTFCCGYLLLQIQVRLEEEFLEKAHGEAYLRYRAQVRRWY